MVGQVLNVDILAYASSFPILLVMVAEACSYLQWSISMVCPKSVVMQAEFSSQCLVDAKLFGTLTAPQHEYVPAVVVRSWAN